jgi:hypothetical protein
MTFWRLPSFYGWFFLGALVALIALVVIGLTLLGVLNEAFVDHKEVDLFLISISLLAGYFFASRKVARQVEKMKRMQKGFPVIMKSTNKPSEGAAPPKFTKKRGLS